MMLRPSRRQLIACVLVLSGCVLAGCGEDKPPIVLEGNELNLYNWTSDDWTGIEIWINRQYRATAPSLRAGQRLIVPLDTFVTGWARRFDTARSTVTGIRVTATSKRGDPVTIEWGGGRGR